MRNAIWSIVHAARQRLAEAPDTISDEQAASWSRELRAWAPMHPTIFFQASKLAAELEARAPAGGAAGELPTVPVDPAIVAQAIRDAGGEVPEPSPSSPARRRPPTGRRPGE